MSIRDTAELVGRLRVACTNACRYEDPRDRCLHCLAADALVALTDENAATWDALKVVISRTFSARHDWEEDVEQYKRAANGNNIHDGGNRVSSPLCPGPKRYRSGRGRSLRK